MRTILACLFLTACAGTPSDGAGGGGGSTSNGGGSAGGSTAAGGGTAGGAAATGGGSTHTGGGTSSTGGGSTTIPPLTADEQTVLAARPYRMVVPTGYDGGTATPFVMLLHGYTFTGILQDEYFQMSELAQAKGFLLATPDGLKDSTNEPYWNATDYCCGSVGTQKTDDVAYLTAIMDDVRLKYRVDPKRVYLVGHSNGGFMAHRMACDRADRIAAIVSLAGAQWSDVSKCKPDDKISVLEVHGDLDALIAYAGGSEFGVSYPGAETTVSDWATLNGCGTTKSSGGADLDLDSTLSGAETTRTKFDGCPTGGDVELWKIVGGSHIPTFTANWGPSFWDFLVAHPKP